MTAIRLEEAAGWPPIIELNLKLAAERDPEMLVQGVRQLARQIMPARYPSLGILLEDGQIISSRVLSSGIDGAGGSDAAAVMPDITVLEARPASGHMPKLLLLDLKRPKLDGIEVLRRLKSDAATKFIPVVVSTSSKEGRKMVRGYDSGKQLHSEACRLRSIPHNRQPGRALVARDQPDGACSSGTTVGMKNGLLKVLLGEDVAADAELCVEALRENGILGLCGRLQQEDFEHLIQGEFMNENEPKQPPADSSSEETHAAEWHTKATRIDQLLVRMNYGIRSAANVILGLTDVIRESELSPNLSQNVSVLRSNAEGLLNKSAEITDLTRAELGSLQLFSASFNLHDTLQQAMDLMSILASCKRIRLTFHISRQLPLSVIGDPVRLSQILITLVRGAIERLEQGEISVKVEHDSNYPDGIKIRFSIADNGRSLPSELIRHMFDGGSDQETTTGGGSEDALLLARHLARMMGGDLWAEVEPKIGAVFHFNVNLPPAPTVDFLQLSEAGAKARTDLHPLRILVADDSADSLRLIRAFLKEAPWGIDSAENGRTAVEMAVSKSYDLILMDLDMPEMNGYIAARQIRISECLHEKPAVPIVALTAHNEAEAASKSIQAGCTAHVTKPIRKAALIETIQRYAGDRRTYSGWH